MYKRIIDKFFGSKISKKNISNKYNNFSYFDKNYSFGNYQRDFYSNNYNTLYSKNVIAFSVINLIARSVSSIAIKLFEYCNEGAKEVKHHPLLQLLKRPNNSSIGSDLIEQITYSSLINGNAYVLKVWGNDKCCPKELFILPSDSMRVVTDSGGYTIAYEYKISEREKKIYSIDSITGESDVMHFKTFNPFDDNYGLSAFNAALDSIEQHESASVWNSCLLKNSARPSGALIAKAGSFFTEEQYKRLREQIDNMYSGQHNSGRPMLLEGGLEWREMGIKPKDMQFIDVKNNAAREIALAFGVPPYLLGIPGDNTYSNLAEAREAFLSYKVLPMIKTMVDTLNVFLVPSKMTNVFLDYDIHSSNIFGVDKDKIISKIEDLSFMTRNEKRRFFNLAPIAEGDVFED